MVDYGRLTIFITVRVFEKLTRQTLLIPSFGLAIEVSFDSKDIGCKTDERRTRGGRMVSLGRPMVDEWLISCPTTRQPSFLLGTPASAGP